MLIMNEHKTPGQLIESLLAERGWTQRLLAAILDLSESTTNKLISGNQTVTADIALMLQEVFEVEAHRFLELQQEYDLAKAKLVARPDPLRAARAELFSALPVAEMIKRRWLEATNIKDMPAVEASITKFFEVTNIGEIRNLPHAAKKTNLLGQATHLQMAWLYRVRQIAKEVLAPKYNAAQTRAIIPKLKTLLSAPEESRHVPRMLMQCGIRLVFVEALKGSKIDGACLWLNDHSPVIGMSLRFDRMDNFWFVLRHELEHVIQGHGKSEPMMDVDMGAELPDAQEELDANKAASDFCAPQARIDSFIARKAPIFPERDFLGLAKVLGVHPAMIAGQIQFKTGRYELFRGHLAKIRKCVLPSAIVDGWGDVAPIGIH